MCGIFAWAGKDPKQFNKGKLDILGIYNESRGTHSCGIAKDGDIVIGIADTKIYKDFIMKSGYSIPKNFPVVIGHTRAATGGAHTIENAHPFGYGAIKDIYEFIGVHNGTLLNHKDLAPKFKVDLTANKEGATGLSTIVRTKIDSEILLECIYKSKDYKVLSQYNGAAALVFTNINEPDVLYCYHGKSRKTDYLEEKEAVEERPLFYYQESKNSVYISSIEGSLKTIGGTKKTIGSFDYNTVYKITKGNIATATKTKISRVGNYQTGHKKYVSPNYESERYPSQRSRYRRNEEIDYTYDSRTLANRDKQTNMDFSGNKYKSLLESNIFNDTPLKLINKYKNNIYFNKLRYHRNGHLISGIYTWIDGYGFRKLGETGKEADKTFWGFVNKLFYKDEFLSNVDGMSNKQIEAAYIPFPSSKDKEIVEPLKFYFWSGIRVKTAADYFACLDMQNNKLAPFTWEDMSHCSAHPVMQVNFTHKRYDAQNILLNGVPFTDTICPLGSEKIYTIANGNCLNIEPVLEDKRENVKNLKEVTKRLEEAENNVQQRESMLPTLAEGDDDLVENALNDIFQDSLRKFPAHVRRLKKYKTSARSTAAIDILESLVKDCTALLAIDIKE